MNEVAQKLIELAIERLVSGDAAGALALIEEARAEEPAARPGWHYLRAVALHALARPGVKEALGACLAAEPTYEPAMEMLGRLDRAAVAATAAADSASGSGSGAQSVGRRSLLGDSTLLPEVDPSAYEMGAEFARGGMGRILRARQRTLDRPVAVKELTRASEAASARFLREAFITARLQHPAIVPIYEAGRWPGGEPFYAMRLVQGRSLEQVIAGCSEHETRLGLLPRVIAAAEAVAYAHSQRIIHRDLKPANILCGDFGETVVIDWGVAKDLRASAADDLPDLEEVGAGAASGGSGGGGSDIAIPAATAGSSAGAADMATGPTMRPKSGGSSSGETVAGTVVGTPAFMPVEQALGKPVDERADVYALGAILYNVLSGDAPYRGANYTQVLLQVAQRPPIPLERLVPDLPRELLDIVEKAMHRDRTRRYPTAAELVADLRRYATGQLVGAHAYSPVELAARWLHQHRTQLSASLAAVALVALAATGVYTWDRQRIKVAYYANKVARYGVPEGIGPVSERAQRHRSATYRFTRRGGHVTKVERINGSRELVDDSSNMAVQLLRYDEKGRLREEVHQDHLGKLRERNLLSTDLLTVQHVDEQGRPRPRKETDDWGRAVKDTDVTRVVRQFDERGFVRELRFHNLYGSPRADERKAFGYRVQADERGQIVYWQALGPKGDPTATAEGLAALRRQFDQLGNVTGEQYLGTDGQPVVLTRYKIAGYRATFDRRGNEVKRAFQDAQGRPTVSSEGIAGWSSQYDKRGNSVRRDFFGLSGEPALLSGGFASLVFKVDARGLEVERLHLDRAGKPVAPRDGTAIWRASYDDQGRLVRSAHLDKDGRPVTHPNGYHRFDVRLDARGNRVEEAYFDVDGKPFTLAAGWSVWRGRYNDQDKELESSYFDARGQPAMGGGYHRLLTDYSDRGQPVLRRYLGKDGKPILYDSGYAAVRTEYDDHGDESGIYYLGIEGRPVVTQWGYAAVRTRHDPQGNAVEVRYVDPDGQPVVNRDMGYATVEREYDAGGRLMVESYRGPGGQPMLGQDGAARLTFLRDERGRVIEKRHFDTRGQLDAGERGYAVVRTGYDPAGHEIERRTLDARQKPVAGRGRYATVRRRFDSRGHELERSFFDADDRPVASLADGAAVVRTRYDDDGRALETSYHDAAGKPVLGRPGHARLVRTYDRRGHLLTAAHLGIDGKPTLSSDHVASRRYTYDEEGQVTEEQVLGPEGQPWSSLEQGNGSRRVRRDPVRGITETEYTGEGGRPVASRAGCMKNRVIRRPGKEVVYECVGPDGRVIKPEPYPAAATELYTITGLQALSSRAQLARIAVGPDDPVRVSQTGHAYPVYRTGRPARDSRVATTCVQRVDGKVATVSIVVMPEAPPLQVGDVVELPARPLPAGAPPRSQLARLDALAIRFQDPSRRPYWKLHQFRQGDRPEVTARIVETMLKDIRDTGVSLERTVKNPELGRPRPKGLYQGKTAWQVMKAAGPDDLRDFFDFVLTYPGKYLGNAWKVNETFATWLINDAPPGKEAAARKPAPAATAPAAVAPASARPTEAPRP
jgi:YD repeat-containing protein